MNMTITDVYSRIGLLVSDPDLTEYEGAMPNAFEGSMCELLRGGDFLPEEVPALVEPYEVSLTTSGISNYIKEVDLTELTKVLKVVDVIDDRITFSKINRSEVNNILQNPLRLPAEGEGFWYTADDKLYFIIDESGDTITSVMVSAVRNPDPDTWKSADLVSDLKYSLTFIQKCIVAAAQYIKVQIAGEMTGE